MMCDGKQSTGRRGQRRTTDLVVSFEGGGMIRCCCAQWESASGAGIAEANRMREKVRGTRPIHQPLGLAGGTWALEPRAAPG